MIMGGALLTKQERQLKQTLETQLETSLQRAKEKKDEKILAVQNKTIRKVQRLNIEYKYTQATNSMIHDGGKSQVSSMLGALKYVGVLH